MQTVSQVAPNGTVNLSDMPGGFDEATLETLFPTESNVAVATPVQQVTSQPGTSPTPVTQAPPTPQPQGTKPDFYLQGERSVYKTPEEAVRGLNEKDQLIEQLRQRYALTTGIDPISGKPVVGPSGQPQGADVNYFQQPDKYLDALYDAAKKGGPEAYRDVQSKFIFDTVAPLQPILQKAARDQATETLTTELPGAKSFVGTAQYQKVLEANPTLKTAIAASESDYRFHSQLPGLYKLAFLASQGMAVPELVAAATKPAPPSQTPTTQPVRTTAQPTTPNMPMTTTRPSFKTIEGIRAIIQNAEAAGAKLEW